MNWTDISKFVKGYYWKTLSPHEVDSTVSNGHEFQGASRLRGLLGDEERELNCRYCILRDSEETTDESINSTAKWYDSRKNQPRRSAEWRLYYPSEVGNIQNSCKSGDRLCLVYTQSEELIVYLIEKDSIWESKLQSVFDPDGNDLSVAPAHAINYSQLQVLEELSLSFGMIVPQESEVENIANKVAFKWSEKLPTTKIFSKFIRENSNDRDAENAPDETIVDWLDLEYAVYCEWEKRKVKQDILSMDYSNPSDDDVDHYLSFAMSLFQSRKSRAGASLENHLSEIFRRHELQFDSQVYTERGEKPDFIFPSIEKYQDKEFNPLKLTMLASKRTAKERFRQISTEADLIEYKHLFMIDPFLTYTTICQMSEYKIKPVLPSSVQDVYGDKFKKRMMSLCDFIEEVKYKQL